MNKILVCISLTIVCLSGFSQNLDIRLLKELNSDNKENWDPALKFISSTVYPLAFGLPSGLVAYALIKKDSTTRSKAVILFAPLVINGIITPVLKNVIKRTRPFQTYSFIEKETLGGGYSFPSGHTSSAFALATSISICYPKWYVIAPGFLWAGAVGYSRLDLGVHYPSDVLAGALVGSGSAYLSYRLNRWLTGKHSPLKHKAI